MNTIETERLIRRICSIIKGEGDPAMAPKLAEDFNTICASVGLRLEQCQSMIAAGAPAQAIQLAETSPNLLDLITLLEFRQADEWRQHCRKQGLLCPEQLSARAISQLNDCYNRGITPQHPLYAAYRQAVMGRKDDVALSALKSIVRLNPSDANAASELARLDAKLLALRLANLGQLLAADKVAAVRELDAIEAIGFQSPLEGEVWQAGQLARSAQLLLVAERLREQGALAEGVAQLDFFVQLKADHKLDWPAEWEARIAGLRTWISNESAARQKEADYNELLSQLGHAILTSEGKDTRSAKVTILELKADQERLHRIFRQVEIFSRPLPDELLQQFRKRVQLVAEKIRRLERLRFGVMAAAATAGVLFLAILALAFLGLQRSNSLAADLKKAQEQHQTRLLEALLKQADSKLVLPLPRLRAAVTAATSELKKQQTLIADYQSAIAKLPPQFSGIDTLEPLLDMVSCFSQAERMHRPLSPDIQTETQPQLDGFRSRLNAQCNARLPALNQQFEKRISAIETAAAVLNDTPDLSRFRSILAEILPDLERALQNMQLLGTLVALRPDLGDRCSVLLERARKDQATLGRLDAALAALARAETPANVGAAVADLAAVDLRQSDYAHAARKARKVMALKDNPESLAGALLMGNNFGLSASLAKAENLDLTPKKVSYEVRKQLMELARDYAVNGKHYRLRLHRDAQLGSYVDWITDGPLMKDDGWHTAHAWTVQDEGPCELSPTEYGSFNGGFLFAVSKPAYGVQMKDLTALTAVWTSSGLANLVDSRSLACTLPPLKVVDGICGATNSSPLMRAYLLNKLLAIMATQPLESGLLFSPSLRTVSDQLRVLGADQIRSGDWFVPAREKSSQPKFEQLFAGLQGVSAFKQATSLINATARASKLGFTLVGHARPDGLPAWKNTPENGFVWGLPESGDLPALLFIVRNGDARQITKPQPLTPLLVYQGDLAGIISESGIRPDEPSFKGILPPLFATPLPAL